MFTSEVLHLSVANRGKKGIIKKLPAFIDIPAASSIEQLQIILSNHVGVSDFNRIGIFDPQTSKVFRDRQAVLGRQESIMISNEILVQDLGPQISWRTVFVVEYAGPIFFHVLLFIFRPRFPFLPASWTGVEDASDRTHGPTDVQTLIFTLFMLHFVKRELETIFLHRFAANTMPAFNIIRNSVFYWLMAGLSCAWSLYAPVSPLRMAFPTERKWLALAARSGFGNTIFDYFGLGLFIIGELCNFRVHYHLAHLRKPGSTEKGIPSCIGSALVTSPNYMFEVLAWIGIIIISRDITVVLFILVGIKYMRSWSRDKEQALRRIFQEKYKKKRYTMLPGLI